MTWYPAGMPPARPIVIGSAALGILLLGIAIGRFATPAKTIERDHIVTSERDTELTWHAYVGHTEIQVDTKTNWETITKWEPGGVVVQTVVANQDKHEATKTDVAENDGKLSERVVEKIVDHEKIVEAAKPDWIFGAGVGVNTTLNPIYAGSIARRIVGPVFLEVQAQRPWAATVGVKILY